jgi:DNA-binding transcriptional regulator PaaX
MGKYVWPSDIVAASHWYLRMLRQLGRSASLSDFMDAFAADPDFASSPDRRFVQTGLYRLQRQGLITKTGTYNSAQYSINHTGIKRLERLSFLDKSRQAVPSTWDGRWRLVLFDIPEELRESRYQIRRLLKELGFRQLQLSVWLHPMPVLDGFKAIREAYGIEEHLLLIEAADFTPPPLMLAAFRKQYPQLTTTP